jgi:hypothetical protein
MGPPSIFAMPMFCGGGMLRSWSTIDFSCSKIFALDSGDRRPQPSFAVEPAILSITIYVVPLYLKAQNTFGTGTEVLRDTNCIVLASASLVDRDALMHILDDTKTIDPDPETERLKRPSRIILIAIIVKNRLQGVALIGLDSMSVVFDQCWRDRGAGERNRQDWARISR